MAVYPPDGVTYHISELFVATGGLRRGLGGHVVFRIRGWLGCSDAAEFFILSISCLRVTESGLSALYQPLFGPYLYYTVTPMPSLVARVIYRRILQFLIFDRLSCYRFKVAFHLHIMLAENRGNWYIDDGAYQAQHEQGNILQRQFSEHLRLPSRKGSLPVTN